MKLLIQLIIIILLTGCASQKPKSIYSKCYRQSYNTLERFQVPCP